MKSNEKLGFKVATIFWVILLIYFYYEAIK